MISRPFAAALIVSLPVASAAAETALEQITTDYEVLRRMVDPAAAARHAGAAQDRWPDVSKAAVDRSAAEARALLERLDMADAASDPATAGALRALLRSEASLAEIDVERIPFTGDSGFQAAPLYAAAAAGGALRSADDAEALIRLIADTPRYFEQNIANMRRGIETGVTAHRDPLATTIAQVRAQLVDDPAESPLYAPFRNARPGIADEDAADRRARALDAVADAVAAYADLLAFLEIEYAPAARRQPGIAALPQGRAHYTRLLVHHTTLPEASAVRIHEIGLAEVARIRTEMDAVLEELGHDGPFEDFLDFLRTDPQFYAETPDALIAEASTLAKRLDAALPTLFGRLPRLPYGVAPVPADIAPGYTTGRYAPGDPARGRAGTYYVNTYRLDQRPLYQLPALTAHEAVPGHHLQIALAQELEDAPDFRKSYYATAFGEGWGLYAERLAGEVGLYDTPYRRFGALSYEMWRACRLVADTGLHWYGWSRAEAEACFRENTALAEHNIETEVTRYIGWPGQATAYKIGELTFRDLRAEAQTALGAAFDIRAFHDLVLAEGSIPLDVLKARVRAWIGAQTRDAAAAE